MGGYGQEGGFDSDWDARVVQEGYAGRLLGFGHGYTDFVLRALWWLVIQGGG